MFSATFVGMTANILSRSDQSYRIHTDANTFTYLDAFLLYE